MSAAELGQGRRPIPIVRILRIGALSGVVALAFGFSRRIGEASGNSQPPGFYWAVGVVSILLLVRAIVTEWSRGAEANWTKDLLWGVAGGGLLTVLIRP